MKTIALTMIVKNEERSLDRCLTQVKPLVDEIIIVDTGSTDRTKEISLSHHAQLFDFTWQNDFSAARNFSLKQSHSDWNLVIDADEYLLDGSRKKLQPFLEQADKIGAIQRKNAYQDGEEISYGIDFISRLLPRGIWFTGKIHEQADSSLPRVPVPLKFEHDGYLKSGKNERNFELILEELESNPNDPYYLYHAANLLRNMKRFPEADPYFQRFCKVVPDDANYRTFGMVANLYNLLEQKHFTEALAFINQYGKSLENFADYQFACGVFYMQLVLFDTKKYISYLPKIEACYLKCLDIGEAPGHQGILGTGSFKAAYNLGVWYEVSGNMDKAIHYYQQAAKQNYTPASSRLNQFKL